MKMDTGIKGVGELDIYRGWNEGVSKQKIRRF